MKIKIDSTAPSVAPQTTGPGLWEREAKDPVLTNAQARSLELMVSLGKLFYEGRTSQVCSIRPRLFPLLIGPTGAGKSWLALLLESLGINDLARAAGVIVREDDLDLEVAGMRTLESLVTRLLLRLQTIQSRQASRSRIVP